ncbi:MAG: double-strand break repair protein AddB [Pseudorhodoplanes sp.]
MAGRVPRVFTVPASTPFLTTLVAALVEGRLVPGFPQAGDPLALARATLYLPTRRACRLAHDVFLDVLQSDAALLPRIAPIGDIDEDELVFAEFSGGPSLDLPPAIGGLTRKLLLAQLIQKWAQSPEAKTAHGAPLVANGPAAAFALAGELARLIDDMTTRQVPWDALDRLVPENMSEHFAKTLAFMKIARETWPDLLRAFGAIEPAERRDRLIAAEAQRLQSAPDGPVIAAGSTGSMPATAEFLAQISRLPNGAIVLPGLDMHLDAASWDLIGGRTDADGREIVAPAPAHPQFSLHGLLKRIGIAREAVEILAAPHRPHREMLVSEALRPAAATDRWQVLLAHRDFGAQVGRTVQQLAVVEAANPEEEALAIACALREAVEARGKTAALITPDRALARRTVAALGRWRVPVDDSGGDRLPDVGAGIFARLVADVALGGTQPVALLALLKHPLCRLGAHDGALAADVRRLEQAVLRGSRPRAGSEGLKQALETLRRDREDLHPRDPRRALGEDDIASASALAAKLAAALEPLEAERGKRLALAAFARRHREALERLSRDHLGNPTALEGREGEILTDLFDDLAATDVPAPAPLSPDEYAEMFARTAADYTVRRPGAPGARIRILGPLEARLQTADLVVLAGLNEGTWPPETRNDPWLSRPMRQDLGLDLPERRIGLSAHDFAQALGAAGAILSRSARAEGAPTVASRFLQRLSAVAGEHWETARENGDKYLAWARALDHVGAPQPCPEPRPTPPVEARPTRLTVTEIETWQRDPYAIYARHILKLVPLDDVDAAPGASDRGTLIHEAIGDFNRALKNGFPDDPLTALLRFGRARFAALIDYPEVQTFWWPRFERIARWYAEHMQRRRGTWTAVHAEKSGEIQIALGARPFTLACRADAIEQQADGRFAILDYKTGQAPSSTQVEIGLAPQLTLEAAILKRGGFGSAAPAGAGVAELVYVTLKGGEPAGEVRPITFEQGDIDSNAERALAGLTELARRFEDATQPYRSRAIVKFAGRYAEYDHLARVKEWSLAGGEANGDGE